MTNGQSQGPLTGVRVIDLSIWIQGPVAASLLGDLGADVVKVEKAGSGDFSRHLTSVFGVDLRRPDASALLWTVCNRNKRTIALDLRRAEARPVFARLLEGADVLVTNLHPEALAELGADEAAVRAINPKIVYARGAGFGEVGPLANDPCQDTVGMAYSGLMFTCSQSPDAPYYPPGALSDVLSGTMVAFGVLAALAERARTGAGQYVSTSQLQALLWLQMLNLGVAANLGTPFQAVDHTRPGNALMNTYACGDGRWLALAAIMPEHWPLLCEAVGLSALVDEPRFAEPGDRAANATALAAIFARHFATAPAAHWVELMRARGIWVAPVNRVEELTSDEQVRANGYLTSMDDGSQAVVAPFTLRGHTPGHHVAGEHGADSDQVLAELGLTQDAILNLKTTGAVW